MSYQNLLIEANEKTALISLNNPPSNSLKMDLLKELDTAIEEMQKNAEIKVIILTGAGKLFASGADISEISRVTSREQAQAMAGYGQNVFMKIENSSKPVISAINGFCRGLWQNGGFGTIIFHCRIYEMHYHFNFPVYGHG